jgi:hypothetical protein
LRLSDDPSSVRFALDLFAFSRAVAISFLRQSPHAALAYGLARHREICAGEKSGGVPARMEKGGAGNQSRADA